MKKIIFPAFALISIVSCKNEQPDKDISVIPANANIKAADTTNVALMTSAENNIKAGMPQTTVQANTTTPQQITATTPSAVSANNIAAKSAAGVNPPHGQPGHVCDASAGAAQKTPVPATVPTAMPKQNAVVSSTGSSIAGPSASVNPPHGQPGHKCDVGANANLSTAAPKAMPQTAPTLQGLPVMPPKNTVPSAAIPSGSSAKLNPAHGQPGHDCKIQVGQPLK